MTNFVVVSSVGIKRVVCILHGFRGLDTFERFSNILAMETTAVTS